MVKSASSASSLATTSSPPPLRAGAIAKQAGKMEHVAAGMIRKSLRGMHEDVSALLEHEKERIDLHLGRLGLIAIWGEGEAEVNKITLVQRQRDRVRKIMNYLASFAKSERNSSGDHIALIETIVSAGFEAVERRIDDQMESQREERALQRQEEQLVQRSFDPIKGMAFSNSDTIGKGIKYGRAD